MLRDVFYYGNKPNVHPREKFAASLEDARNQCTTEHFWIINEYCDYRDFDWDFDFEFLSDEDVWAEEHNNVWPSQHQKDSGTWLCPSKPSEIIIYRNDVITVKRKNIKNDFWLSTELVDETKFDFSWHPDPTEPDYIYEFGTQWHDRGGPRYVPKSIVRLSSGNPIGPIKYVYDVIATLVENKDRWVVPDNIDTTNFDFSWVPHPDEQPYIYQFGTQWQKTGGPKYIAKGATDIKYVSIQKAKALPVKDNWEIAGNVVIADFDYSWHHDETDQPYIYVFGNNQYPAEIMPTIQYLPQDAVKLPSGKPIGRTIKYIDSIVVTLGENKKNWVIPDEVDTTGFDFSWLPDPNDPPYVYQFGTQWQKTGGPKYLTPGIHKNSDIKYIDTQKVKRLPNKNNFEILDDNVIADFDYSWHPDDTDDQYLYVFGNTQYSAEVMPTIQYVPASIPRLASGKPIGQIKYVNEIVAKLGENKKNWIVPNNIDVTEFDFSWVPNPHDEPYVYQFGTQWQKTGGPKYIAEGATDIKYIDTQKVKILPNKNNWSIPNNIDAIEFDFSWHPDDSSPPYIYRFPTQWAASGGPVYTVEGATEIKYVDIQKSIAKPTTINWDFDSNVLDVNNFDFSWHPDSDDEAFIYQFGTQWQKTGGPKYITPGVHKNSSIKYIEIQKVKRLPNKNNFEILDDNVIADFDYSWHHDETDEPYVYVFGNNQYPAEIMPTIQYVPASIPRLASGKAIGQVKYVNEIVATMGENKTNWVIPKNVDTTDFNFSWKPNPKDPAYIYEFGTQWQKTGGPKYIVPGATEIKYIDTQKVKILPNKNNWSIPKNIDITDFDFSWHPDDSSPPYIYKFPTQWAASGGPVYTVEGATEIKYVDTQLSTAMPNKTNWDFDPTVMDVNNFDFSWHPNSDDEAFIYQFGTQWQKTGGPKYITPGVHKNSDIKYIDTQKVKRLSNKNNFEILDDTVIADFDYSWHHDETDEPYVYVFGNNQYPAEVMPTIQYVPKDGVRLASGKAIGQVKYVNEIVATLGENKTNWVIPNNIDTSEFDFSWVPDPHDDTYIYQFGTQWQKTGGPQYILPTIVKLPNGKYLAPIKYIDGSKAKILPNKTNFTILDNIVVKDFDYSWHPADTDEQYIYVFGNNQYPAEVMPTIQYVPESIQIDSSKPTVQVKYVNDIVATLDENKSNWIVPENVDTSEFDFSWIPNPHDEPYVYQFGTQWQKTGGAKYISPGIVKLANGNYLGPIKYIEGSVVKTLADKTNWIIPNNLDANSFDFSWHPDDTESSYIYEFGTQWQKTGGPRYIVEDATEIKYVPDLTAKRLPDKEHWEFDSVTMNVDSFDFSWHPDSADEAFIYQFGTQWQKTGGPKYITPGVHKNSAVKYIDAVHIKALPSRKNWIIPEDIDSTKFDFSWHPDSTEAEPYIYQFGTQHQKTGGPQYVAIGVPRLASGKPIGQVKYVDVIKSKKLTNLKNWANVKNTDVTFDFSWHPDDTDPPTTYQFGTLVDREDGPKYTHPDTLDEVVVFMERIEKPSETDIQDILVYRYEIETTLEDLVKKHPNEIFWAMHKNIDYETFNFDWRPEIVNIQWENEYVYVFGSPDSEITQTYFVNASMYLKGNTDFKFVQTEELTEKYLASLFKKSDMFFVDRSNNESQSRFEKLKQKFPTIQKTRYLNSWVDTINRCINRSTTELCWILNSELDYTDFDFEYYPNPWQMKMVQVFGTQWSHWGTTFMVNRETFAQDTKHIKIIEHLSNLNFVKDRKAKATNVLYDIIYVDHGNMDMSQIQGNIVIKFQDSYIATFQKMLDILPVKKEHYVWIASTVCDYSTFDFTYICDPFAKDQLHVFPSDRQKFGDTFLIDVNKLRTLIEDMNALEDYVKINYNQSQRVKRLSAPVVVTEGDTHVENINTSFNFPYAVFVTEDNKDINLIDSEPMSLWTPESKNIQITSVGGTRIVVPKEAKDYVKRELYDYPYIITNSKLAKSSPMDIVFLSNGETGAEENYQHLLKVTEGLSNRVTRVDGVNGRVAAYHAAAEASNTPWMFTVFAKLKVSNKFDWNWQPDRLQLPKHYVFYASNPVNGLKYGSMAMIAYNKKLTLANQGKGLDFTMDDEHEVLEINSGVANFNTDAWVTWRTAFREALKLRDENSEISKHRLEMWLTVGMGKFNEYSTDGAQHAVEYYEEVNGDFDKLKLSYDWPWLRTYYESKYNNVSL